jgi:formylglycine-generating enzyme required for sulfatase activity
VSDIFLSYASDDRERVRPLAEALEQAGWSVFWDRIIPVGKTWYDMLEEELEAARSLLVVWSKNSIKSKYVKIEANEGLRKEVPLSPVLLDGVLPPLAFRDIQAADFSRWDGTTESAAFQALARDIKRTLGSPQGPEPEPSEIKSSEPEHAEVPPPETKPPEISKGRLWLDTQPQKAGVKFLNLEVEFAQGMEIEPGRYELEVSADGYETKTEGVEVDAGEDKRISIVLTRIKSHLWVETEPKDAEVKILNLEAEFYPGMELEPGDYQLEVSKNGYEKKVEEIELGIGEDKHSSLKLSPIIPPDLAEPVKPETIEAEPSETEPPGPEAAEPEPVEARPAEPPKPKTPEQMRKRRALLIGIGAVVLVNLIVGLSVLIKSPPVKISTQVRQQKANLPQAESQPVAKTLKTITNSLGMKFVLIPAGTFKMGNPAGEPFRDKDERQHQVTISQPFYLQTTEVTQGQWRKVMGKNPSYFQQCGDDCPVEHVSWHDAQEFIKKLNRMEKTDKYRLPTEAEWEYACRAGSTSTWCFGDNEAKLGEYAWYRENSGSKTHPVKQKKPNAWGLYDMHGNVWGWVQDRYGDYPAGPVTDPTGSASGERRVLRGGSWCHNSRYTRSANRGFNNPVNRYYFIGFRVARAL